MISFRPCFGLNGSVLLAICLAGVFQDTTRSLCSLLITRVCLHVTCIRQSPRPTNSDHHHITHLVTRALSLSDSESFRIITASIKSKSKQHRGTFRNLQPGSYSTEGPSHYQIIRIDMYYQYPQALARQCTPRKLETL